MISKTDKNLPLVVLEGIQHGNRFYSLHESTNDPTMLCDGTVAYRVLAYCDTGYEARSVIESDGYDMTEHFIESNRERFEELGMDVAVLSGTLRMLEAQYGG